MSNKVFENKFKQAVKNRELLFGCWSALGNPISTEVLGYAGFDWLLLDGEHAPNDVLGFVPQLMALKGSSSAPIVRPAWNDFVLIKRLLDIGFYNFLIPFVEDEVQAKQAVAATRYPPEGIRGVSVSHRSNEFGTITNYFQDINKNITIIAQIESRKSVENVEKIAAVDGIDAIFIGPSDLSAGFGHFGQPKNPEVQEAIKHVFDVAKKYGKGAGILAPVEADARHYVELGATFVGVGSDLGVFRSGTQALADKFMKSK